LGDLSISRGSDLPGSRITVYVWVIYPFLEDLIFPWRRRKPEEKLEINGPWTLFLTNIWTINMQRGPWTIPRQLLGFMHIFHIKG
jgi:hypothetical protein